MLATNQEATAEDLAQKEVDIEIQKLETIIALRKAAGEDTLSLELQLAQQKRAIAQQEIDAEADRSERRKEAALELTNQLQEILIQSIQNEADARVTALEEEAEKKTDAIDRELENEDLSEKEREKLEKEKVKIKAQAAEEASKIQREAAEKEKEIALFRILIEGGVAAVKALTIDPTGVLTAITAAITLAQFSFVSSQPIPEFAQGTPSVSGGVKGKDSVLSWLMPEERVVPVSDNKKYWGPLEAIRNGNYEDYVYSNNIVPALNEAISAQKLRSNSSFADNVANSLSLQSGFSDMNLLRSDMDTRKILRQMNRNLESLQENRSTSPRKI